MEQLIEVLVFGKRPMWEVSDILRERMELHRKFYKDISAETIAEGLKITGVRK